MSWSLERLRDPASCEALIRDTNAFIALDERFLREQWLSQIESDLARSTFPCPERFA